MDQEKEEGSVNGTEEEEAWEKGKELFMLSSIPGISQGKQWLCL